MEPHPFFCFALKQNTKIFKYYILLILLLSSCEKSDYKNKTVMQTGKNWPVYGGNKKGNRYSTLTKINKK